MFNPLASSTRVCLRPGVGMSFRIRRIVVATLGGLALALSVGLAHAQAPRSTALVVAEDVVPQTFDPTQSSQIRTWYAWQLVYEGLVRASADGKIEPVLATRWTVDPAMTTYEFTLRDGVKFSDGSSMSADDVVASFQRLMQGGLPYAKDRFKSVDSVTKVNDQTVRF